MSRPSHRLYVARQPDGALPIRPSPEGDVLVGILPLDGREAALRLVLPPGMKLSIERQARAAGYFEFAADLPADPDGAVVKLAAGSPVRWSNVAVQAARNERLQSLLEEPALSSVVTVAPTDDPVPLKELTLAPTPRKDTWEGLAGTWESRVGAAGTSLPEGLATAALLALGSALCTGSLVLLNGPVGVGKSSLVRTASRLLGGSNRIIPVRPAWLDPGDLLGYFDPLQGLFRPTPFLTALAAAARDPDRLHLVCLDELNLAKIENYGADLLSCLEYAHMAKGDAPTGLPLYAAPIESELRAEAATHRGTQRDPASASRLMAIETLLAEYPSDFVIPRNAVMVGTLNADETTYDLSPKVIDRSYVITYPPADLRAPLAERGDVTASTLVPKDLQGAVARHAGNSAHGWDVLLEWNERYLNTLGRPLGHRVRREHQTFMAVAGVLGVLPEDAFGHFVAAKVLPRIAFNKLGDRPEKCDAWLDDVLEACPVGVGAQVERLRAQLDDEDCRHVDYWS